ncbi:hypothetical protein [Lichenibacterium minor]|uniref:hypothetical protein n=1 Tax=Lichenibacterium minor TaxID=2316528 RepID=UPI0013EC0663|nr:hypothetical protein [Lichenibacterium minor]
MPAHPRRPVSRGGKRGGDRAFRQMVRRRRDIAAREAARRLRPPRQADAIGIIAAAARPASVDGVDAREGGDAEPHREPAERPRQPVGIGGRTRAFALDARIPPDRAMPVRTADGIAEPRQGWSTTAMQPSVSSRNSASCAKP